MNQGPLLTLSIKNIALIDSLEVELSAGLSVITGETGAGKSIIIGAIQFLLGGKSDKDLLRTGSQRGRVSLVYNIEGLDKVSAVLSELGLLDSVIENDWQLILSRELNSSGRTVCRVAGETLPLNVYRRVTDRLIELHGQHGHHALLNEESHLFFLDTLGGAAYKESLAKLADAHSFMQGKKKELRSLVTDAKERARLIDMYTFQLAELRDAKLEEGEEERLQLESKKARHQERISTALRKAYVLLAGAERSRGSLDNLKQSITLLTSISEFDERYAALASRMKTLAFELDDIVRELDDAKDEAYVDQNEIDKIESRLESLSRLSRKYGATTREMLDYMARIERELESAVSTEDRQKELEREIIKAQGAYLEAAMLVSTERRAVAEYFSNEMTSQLSDLAMAKARFDVSVETFAEDKTRWSENGIDRAAFMFSANEGEPLKPLSQVASGGELSRVMLSLKTIEANKSGVPVLIFDEIDTGISGRAAQSVALKLSNIARYTQVLCVTHLPQIAAIADNPYCVSKASNGGKTTISLRALSEAAHVEEIARLISGADESGGTAYAAELRRAAAERKLQNQS
ncbi:MAG: DNA repair protein RecN [Oscillospiraceae bacterium]|jgi:DNA repair protein RecN (Recombination protein N)|nr:DNA repair protein RecN [Oscillospiraceae bacterium]